jgi:SOS response regulatory protein OraA/RecX
MAVKGLNQAVEILSENPTETKKIIKIKNGVDNIIVNPEVMKQVAKLYSKSPRNFSNMIFLPHMIMNTLVYYGQESLSDEEKKIGELLDKESLINFCEKILKKQIRRYRKCGLSSEIAYQLATVIPTSKLLKNNRLWFKKLIQTIYMISANEKIDLDTILSAVRRVDKKKYLSKKDFLFNFYAEFILSKASNKNYSFNDDQKELHELLIEKTLGFLNELKKRRLRELLKAYIKRRKTAESYKNDTRRVIKFVDHANSSSPYENIKSVVESLISDNSSNELYLS